MTARVSDFVRNFGATCKSIVKIAMQSRPCSLKMSESAADRALIVMANGPSLRNTIDKYADQLCNSDTMAVNFAANTPDFFYLKPKYYVLADPHFFTAFSDANVARLLGNLRAVQWPMTLIVDVRYASTFVEVAALPDNVTVRTFNAVGVEGFSWFERLVFSCGLAMPRPRNVLIPALMGAMRLGYKEIYIVGADHSWMKELHVGEDNIVVSGMSHFYKESDKERSRVRSEYESYRLHDIIYSLYVAFRSYHSIERYACSKGVDIFNSTQGSFIDAFRRANLPL